VPGRCSTPLGPRPTTSCGRARGASTGAGTARTYDKATRQANTDWYINAGINLGGNDARGLGLNISYGSGGLSYGLGGYYNPWAWESNPVYEPQKWNDGDERQYSNNCYSYACDDLFGHPYGGKPQPGQASGTTLMRLGLNLEKVLEASMSDGGFKKPNFLNRLGFGKRGYYSVYLVVDNSNDYHWYRQDKGGGWSHKRGHGPVHNFDASGKTINNPARANRSYFYASYIDGIIHLWRRNRK
jgi:hypothetical protein